MTRRKHLKKKARERQERTGERYTTALAHVREGLGAAFEAPPILHALNDHVAPRGWRGRAYVTRRVLETVPEAAREAFLDVAVQCAESACRAAPIGSPLRSVVEGGDTPVPMPWREMGLGARFVDAVRAGGSVPADGRHVLFTCEAGGLLRELAAVAFPVGVPGFPAVLVIMGRDQVLEKRFVPTAETLSFASLLRP